jgi:hypothetical protein
LTAGLAAVPRFTFQPGNKSCDACGRKLNVLGTRGRRVLSLAYGEFRAVEELGFCPKHSKRPPARSLELPRIVGPCFNIAYDLMVHVGVARFVECRQLKEIRAELLNQRSIDLPSRTIGDVARRFVAYFQVVHEQSVPLLRRDMRERGGYILHIDGTCEEGSRVLLVCFDSLSGQVLESRKVGSENTEEVRIVLKDVRRDWGIPLAIVHDLRTSLITAAGIVFQGVPQFVCHYHLAADVGEDILAKHVDRLRRLIRRTRVRPRLGVLCRSLRAFAVTTGGQDHVVSAILAARSTQDRQQLISPEALLGTIHALISWILAFTRSGEGYGFPFDQPYLTLYHRIVAAHRLLDCLSTTWPEKPTGVLSKLKACKDILERVVLSEDWREFEKVVTELQRDLRIFQRFRAALRICPKGGKARRNDGDEPNTLNREAHMAVLKRLRTSLLKEARRGGSTASACKVVVHHIDKYWPFLFGHAVRQRPRPIVVPRTNNAEERLFRTIKRQCRRLHGRGHLRRDVDAMPAGTALILNLKNPSYSKTVYGGAAPRDLASRFCEVDPRLPRELMKKWRLDRFSVRIPRKFESVPDLPDQLAPFITAASRYFSK